MNVSGRVRPETIRALPRFFWWLLRLTPGHQVGKVLSGFTTLKNVAVSGLLDEAWYLRRYPDIAEAGVDPLCHFVAFGLSQGRSPNLLFDSQWYLVRNPDVRSAGLNPLEHFLRAGAAEGREPGPLFDVAWYLAENPDVAASGVNPLTHFWSTGLSQGREPNPNAGRFGYVLTRELPPAPKPLDAEALRREPLWEYLVQEYGAETAARTLALLHDLVPADSGEPRWEESSDERIDFWCSEIARRSEVTTADVPKVSIVLPVHNQLRYTLACLVSLFAWETQSTCEVIVADDASTDATAEVIGRLPAPIRLLRQAQNLGFLRNCNEAARLARGRILVLLNNDTFVLPGWLDGLVQELEEQPRTGLVGSKLLYPDAVLQEAGGVIWADGSGCNVGRGQDPFAPSFGFAREVDYCSGAAVALWRSLWDRLEGFDERYSPAYYEDTDLAFRVRAAGYRVVYQPASQVIHFEGRSHGTDVSQGLKRYQVRNQQRFLERWREEVSDHGVPVADSVHAERYLGPRALYVEGVTPTPDQDSGSVDAVNLLRMLKGFGFHVTFFPALDSRHLGRYTRELQRLGVECLYYPYVSNLGSWLREHGEQISLVFLNRCSVAEIALGLVRRYCPSARIMFNTVDLHFLREERHAELTGDAEALLRAQLTRQVELELANSADLTLVVGEQELEMLRREVPGAIVRWLPLPREMPNLVPRVPDAKDIVFIGGFKHAPNRDAVEYFVREIWPIVRAKSAEARLVVAGSHMPDSVKALAGAGVEMRGFVEDLEGLFQSARISVAPLRYGSGQKGKVVTSLSFGVPVVATPIAAEGMALSNGEHLLVAETASDFAEAVLRLLDDDALWERFSRQGRAAVAERFDYARVADQLRGLLGELGFRFRDGSVQREAPVSDEAAMASLAFVRERDPFGLARADFPGVSVSGYEAWGRFQAENATGCRVHRELEASLVRSGGGDAFTVRGYCFVCDGIRELQVDFGRGGGIKPEFVPNWRETLVCPTCALSNRMRASMHLLNASLVGISDARVYVTEPVTPFFAAVKRTYPQAVGSEYLRDGTKPGATNAAGVRCEDVTRLSFPDQSFDAVLSMDVLEHVPDTDGCLREFSRVLKARGRLVLSAPFVADREHTLIRARVGHDGNIEHFEEAEYHGDPLDGRGGLCFYHFGWDILERMREAGFASSSAVCYWSARYGYLGPEQMQFVAVKPG